MIDHYPTVTSDPVTRPIMLQSWLNISYLHWRVPVHQVADRLPPGLQPDTFDGSGWVGLVPFHMKRIRLPGLPPFPYVGTFPETNVRTYVRGPDGRPGVWFDSLDISRLLPVAVARLSYRLPYMWSKMGISEEGARVEYRTERQWPNRTTSQITLDRGEPVETDELDRFLTARWGLYTMLGKRLAYAPVDHPEWPLQEAELVAIDDELVRSAGYRVQGRPLVRYSTGVPVKVGLPVSVNA